METELLKMGNNAMMETKGMIPDAINVNFNARMNAHTVQEVFAYIAMRMGGL